MSELTSTVIPPFEEIGGCRLLHQVGQGGMGVVFAAEHLALKRRVAIKLLPESKADDHHIQRFIEEARTCARIQHPNVVPIHNVGYDRGRYFIEMQYVDGQNLADIVRTQGGPIPWRTALKIIRHAARGLQAVHEAGLIHRDVKPSNIMIAGDRVYVMDFGLVRKEAGSELTQSGVIVGTPAFMSPEQCQGEDLDRRTDVYSLGATLYFLLTGRLPFDDNSLRAMLSRISRRESPAGVCSVNPYVPPPVGATVERAMEFDRERRYRTVVAFHEDIRQLLRRSSDIDSSTLDTSNLQLHDTRPQTLVPELEPLEAIPSTSLGDRVQHWKLWLVVAGVAVTLLTIGLLLHALFGGGTSDDVPPVDEVATMSLRPEEKAQPPDVDTSAMIRIPAGTVHLGADSDRLRAHLATLPHLIGKEARIDNLVAEWTPDRVVAVDEFYIDKYEVTNSEYAEFVRATGHRLPRHWQSVSPPVGQEQHPVTHVSYDDATAFAAWAGKQLPTIAQWIRAFRGDGEEFYPWGNEVDMTRANVGENSAFPRISDVTATPEDRSRFGVCNLVGVASEIVRDRTVLNGTDFTVVVGGNWLQNGSENGMAFNQVRIARQVELEAQGFQDEQIGFRCVVEVNETK